MNVSCRSGVVVVVAFLFSSEIALAAEPIVLRWSELEPVLKGRRISVQLTAGATVEGRYSSLQEGALTLQVTKTSAPAEHPKGATKLARSELAQITVKRLRGRKGRIIGLIAGGAIAATIVGIVHGISKNEVGGWSSTSAPIAAAGGGGAAGIGYLAGWLADCLGSRPAQVVRILPD
jgi:hypothetical protein